MRDKCQMSTAGVDAAFSNQAQYSSASRSRFYYSLLVHNNHICTNWVNKIATRSFAVLKMLFTQGPERVSFSAAGFPCNGK